jgi:lipopolysaccharide transport system ATP-binding protein
VTAPRLELRGVSKRYRRGGARSMRQALSGRATPAHWEMVLRDVDLTVHPGEVIGVVGRNGGGKSTLLRVAAGLTQPTTGTVRRRADVSGLLTLNASASGDLSGADNAVTAAVLAGLSPRQARARLPEIGEFAGLDDAVLREPLRTYSDGMKVRLAFAAAVFTNPDLLFIDEVLAVGDISFQEKCLTYIEQLRDRGCALLVASHVMEQLRRLSTGAVWLREGSVYAAGAADEVLDSYERSMDERSGPPREALDGGYRKGTGAVVIETISCAGREGSAGSTLLGSALTVRFDYRRHASAAAQAHASVCLRRVDTGADVIDLTTEGSGAGPIELSDSGQVSLTLDRVDLEPGAYWVDAGLYSLNWEDVYDYRWDAVQVRVLGAGTSGAIQPPHRWRAGGAT